MRVGLVGCVKTKLAYPAEAKDLYISPLFRGRRAFVEKSCDRWFILSALHGLIEPKEVLAPYDMTLKDASASERRRWSAEVLRDLERKLTPLSSHVFEIHAGDEYRSFGLTDGIVRFGGAIEIPSEGFSFGQQLAFYREAANSPWVGGG